VRVLLGIAALPLVLGLTSCSEDDPEPILAPTPTASPTPSPTATETGPSETPEEFIRRWVEIYNEMQTTGDTSEYRAVGPDCRPCREVAEQIDKIFENGGSIRTKGWSVVSIGEPSGDAQTPSYDVRIKSTPTFYTERAGGPKKSFPGGTFVERFVLKLEDGQWTMLNTAQVAS
jgi:hypothetical protein